MADNESNADDGWYGWYFIDIDFGEHVGGLSTIELLLLFCVQNSINPFRCETFRMVPMIVTAMKFSVEKESKCVHHLCSNESIDILEKHDLVQSDLYSIN